jgi:WD40 repeat protein
VAGGLRDGAPARPNPTRHALFAGGNRRAIPPRLTALPWTGTSASWSARPRTRRHESGTWPAAAGWTGWNWHGSTSIYLFDRASGQLRERIRGLPNVIHHLAYSPDGRYLAAALGAGGIWVYRAEDSAEAFRGECDTISVSVDFDRRGRLLSACLDGHLRLYDACFKLIAERSASGGKRPFFARFSPDGIQIAVGFVGFADSAAVNLLSGDDLHFLYAPDTPGVSNGDLSKAAWSADGRYLYAAGRYDDASGWNPVLRWNLERRGAAQAFRVSTDTVMDLRPLKDGRLAFRWGCCKPIVADCGSGAARCSIFATTKAACACPMTARSSSSALTV